MLVWLSLLLWTGTCCAMEMHGQESLGRFFVVPENYERIDGMEFFFSLSDYVTGIRVKTGSKWSQVYCREGFRSEQLLLDRGEDFVSVRGHYQVYMLSFTFTTSWNQEKSAGHRKGRSFTSGSSSSGKVLTGIIVQCGALGLSRIGFEWDYPLDTINTTLISDPDTSNPFPETYT